MWATNRGDGGPVFLANLKRCLVVLLNVQQGLQEGLGLSSGSL